MNRGNHGFRVGNGITQTTIAFNLQGGRTLANAHRGLIRMGIIAAWQAKIDAGEKDRLSTIEADRRRNEKNLAKAVSRAKAPSAPTAAPAAARTPVQIKDLFMAPPAARTAKAAPTGMYTKIETVDKALAAEWLARPLPTLADGRTLVQRPINGAWVGDLIKAAEAGDWKTTHQGIALAPGPDHPTEPNTGGVIDGQHRLTAIVLGDLKVDISVAYNADPDTFDTLDIGRVRTLAHMFTIRGEKNATLLGAAVKLMYTADLWQDDPKGPMADWTMWNRMRVTPVQAEHVLDRHPDIRDDVAHAGLYTSRPLNMSGAAVSVFRYLTRHTAPDSFSGDDDDPGLLDEFLMKIRTGMGLVDKDDPAARLRNWFLTGAHRRVLVGEEPNRRPVPGREVTLLKLITSWNKAARGEKVKQVKVQEREAMVMPLIPRRTAR